MVVGFNHNIKHRGKMYHIQTEDSGLENPHIITHLFVGGNILASKKTSYADIVGADNLLQVVRELMEEQHKEMLRNLINGVYDNADRSGRHFQPGQLAPGENIPAPQLTPGTAAKLPPEVLAARALPETPKINEVGVETLFVEALLADEILAEERLRPVVAHHRRRLLPGCQHLRLRFMDRLSTHLPAASGLSHKPMSLRSTKARRTDYLQAAGQT